MLAPASSDRKRDHLSAHHHHMVPRVYSFDTSTGLTGAKITAPSLVPSVAVSKPPGSFFPAGVTSSPPPATTATAGPNAGSQSQLPGASKKSRLEPVPSQAHSSPTTSPPSSSATSPANSAQITSPAPLRCTICNGESMTSDVIFSHSPPEQNDWKTRTLFSVRLFPLTSSASPARGTPSGSSSNWLRRTPPPLRPEKFTARQAPAARSSAPVCRGPLCKTKSPPYCPRTTLPATRQQVRVPGTTAAAVTRSPRRPPAASAAIRLLPQRQTTTAIPLQPFCHNNSSSPSSSRR